MRFIFVLLFALLSTSLQAAQDQHTRSPLVCFEIDGMIEIASRMVEPTQVGSLGNTPSTDIWLKPGTSYGQKKAGCDYNYNYRTLYPNIAWLPVNQWLIKLEIVQLANGTLMWRAADILRSNEYQPRANCLFFRRFPKDRGVSARAFLDQRFDPMPHYCSRASLPKVRGAGGVGPVKRPKFARPAHCDKFPLSPNATPQQRQIRRQLCGD